MSMKFTLTMDCGNAAFEPEEGGQQYEIARILAETASKIEQGDWTEDTLYALRDSNGNKVGTFCIET